MLNGREAMKGGTLEVGGLSGAGKSTVARRLAAGLGIPFIDFADCLLEQATGGVTALEHDAIVTWRPEDLDERVRQVQGQLASRTTSGERFVLETHICPNNHGEGYRPTPPEQLRARLAKGIILVVASYSDLLTLRKARGAGRDVPPFSEEQYSLDSQATLAAAIALASMASLPCFVFRNRPGGFEKGVQEVLAVGKRMMN